MTTLTLPRQQARFWLSPRQRRNLLIGLMFVAPAIIGFLIFTLWPVVQSLYYSFTDYNILQPPYWVGLRNYQDLLKDRLFGLALTNTLIMVGIGLPIHLIFDLGMAFLLNQRIRGLAIYRTIFYIPSVTPVVASAIVWLWLFNGQYGIINVVLGWFGVPRIGWLTDPNWTKPAMIFMGLWFGGNTILIYLAGLQEVPLEMLEAAELDGAGAWQKTRFVTLPMMSPVIFYTLIINLVGYFQYFTEAWVMTANREGAAGGPANSLLFYSMYLYQSAFQNLKMGYASAQAWILFLVVLVATIVLFRTSGWVYYHAEGSEG
jgi:multiple sugar transport system permease protein